MVRQTIIACQSFSFSFCRLLNGLGPWTALGWRRLSEEEEGRSWKPPVGRSNEWVGGWEGGRVGLSPATSVLERLGDETVGYSNALAEMKSEGNSDEALGQRGGGPVGACGAWEGAWDDEPAKASVWRCGARGS